MIVTFDLPENLNGRQLEGELADAGCFDATVTVVGDAIEVYCETGDEQLIAAVVAAHVPHVVDAATLEEQVSALPDPTQDMAGFRSGLVDLLRGVG